MKAELKEVSDKRLKALMSLVVTCPDLDSFRQLLRAVSTQARTLTACSLCWEGPRP